MEKKKTKLTQDEIDTARDTDLPSLLDSLGYTVTRVGRYYSTKEMDSQRIKDRKTWLAARWKRHRDSHRGPQGGAVC